jgi:16S rRNA processing protein RimM
MTEDSRDPRSNTRRPRRSPRSARAGAGARADVPAASAAPSPPEPEWLLIGRVIGPFGIRGELKVWPETDFPERFAQTPALYLGADHAPYAVAGARLGHPHVIVRLAQISDASAAERLRGLPVYVPVAQAVPLPPDRFYQHDLIGLRAEHADGTPLGPITDVYTGPGNDVFVVRAARTGREVLVPAVKEMIVRVDLAAGVVVMRPIPGLFDDDFETAG